jgi:hypothetical protein
LEGDTYGPFLGTTLVICVEGLRKIMTKFQSACYNNYFYIAERDMGAAFHAQDGAIVIMCLLCMSVYPTYTAYENARADES